MLLPGGFIEFHTTAGEYIVGVAVAHSLDDCEALVVPQDDPIPKTPHHITIQAHHPFMDARGLTNDLTAHLVLSYEVLAPMLTDHSSGAHPKIAHVSAKGGSATGLFLPYKEYQTKSQGIPVRRDGASVLDLFEP